MKSLMKTLLVASVLVMATTNAQAWWDNSYGPGYDYGPVYYSNSGWDDGTFWSETRGYGRGRGSGDGEFNFSMSARARADTEWDGNWDGNSYGGSGPYYGPPPYYYVPPHPSAIPEAGE